MQYQNIWSKVLNPHEEVKYEFTIGKKFRKFNLIAFLILGIIFLVPPVTPLGLVLLFVSFFYYGFYLKTANAYAFTDNRVLVHKGWLSTKLITTEYQKITDVVVVEPLLSRIFFKTGMIKVNTAGTGLQEIVLMNVEAPYEVKKKLDELRAGR